MRGLAIAICCLGLSTFARSSVKVEKIVPHECTQLLRIAVTLDGKPVNGAEIAVRQDFYPEGDPRSFISTRDDGIASVPKLAPGNYRVDVSFNGIRSAIFDEPLTAVLYVHVVAKLDVSTVPIDLGNHARDLWRADRVFDQQLKVVPWHGHDRIQSLRVTILDPAGAKVQWAKIWVVRMTPQATWELVSKGTNGVNDQFSTQLPNGPYLAICSSAGFRTGIVPFEVTKDGSGELRIVLQIAPASQ